MSPRADPREDARARAPSVVSCTAAAAVRPAHLGQRRAGRRSALLVLLTLLLDPLLVPPVAAAQAPSEVDPAPAEVDVGELLAAYAHEPTVEQVVAAALRIGTADPARARAALRRARWSALLPDVSGGIRRGQAVDLDGLLTTDGDRTNVSTDDDLTLDLDLRFRLGALLAPPGESSLLRELRALELERIELIRLVIALYFERRRLQLERDLAPSPDLVREMRIAELTAFLDALTEGIFRRREGGRHGWPGLREGGGPRSAPA
ncbi:MAG: hypothetical protein ACFCGT_12550 [Sandaracinaceae bacterium]